MNSVGFGHVESLVSCLTIHLFETILHFAAYFCFYWTVEQWQSKVKSHASEEWRQALYS
jgi:hypothetical protein